ncbi:hypothetical protein GGI04_002445 [Coemansia thaxteri]|uniref:Uncharacterized protein n=1 Tax=Coemansia thaxteri TaxID=2663907 RepID=A0A9W8EIH8_9FUNG|nr:hypothetical protein H4R26_002394 [Coemansia thaxteri]KAJ2004898.1 hypothetical protein GGI04_002445 [Coemansia thaxteri]KAJ2470964.1 hypothetical protein GGI02_002579 [Coemansia sp. RSA 2322]
MSDMGATRERSAVPKRSGEQDNTSQQQRILDVLRMACAEAMRRPDFAERLQEIKQRFYVRDFDGIFLDPTNLSVYTANYVPRRALCYYEIFNRSELKSIINMRPNVYCLGAGSGSELLGISAAASCDIGSSSAAKTNLSMTIHSQDYTDWSSILSTLEETIRYKWGITEQQIKYQFSMGDLLHTSPDIERNIASSQLVTAMFVFNELFSDKSNAMNFVKTMVKCVAPGSYFLLVDSAGSFSSIKVGDKSYMSYMFFDSLGKHFTPIISEDSVWFRHAPGLDYPLGVENMRYFLRLYQKQ